MGCFHSCTRSASRQSPSGTRSDPPWNDTYEINCQVLSLVAKHWFQHRGNSASMSSLPSNSSKPACGTCLPMVLSCRTMAKVITGSRSDHNTFCDQLMGDNFFQQFIPGPTHIAGNKLDLLLCNCQEVIEDVLAFHLWEKRFPSDQYVV